MSGLRALARVGRIGLAVVLAGCGTAAPAATFTPPTMSTPTAPATTTGPTPTLGTGRFPSQAFAVLNEELVAADLAAKLQAILDNKAGSAGIAATVMSASGTWSGAVGKAAGSRDVTPDDQFAIASITKTLVAAQVMRLLEAGELRLDDLAADRLPAGLEFDTNGATIEQLLSMRSGIPENLQDPEDWESLTTDPLRVWTTDEVLATVGSERIPAGETVEYRGNNYLLLSLIVEEVTGRPTAEVLRGGVLAGDGYERVIYQPDERPTDPVAMPDGASANTFDNIGGYLPSLAAASALGADGNMASDSLSLARWFRALCAAEVVSAASLDEMTDFDARPEYGLGLIDRSGAYWSGSGALGHIGAIPGYTTAALCFQDPVGVVVVLANAEHDVDTLAGDLVQAART